MVVAKSSAKEAAGGGGREAAAVAAAAGVFGPDLASLTADPSPDDPAKKTRKPYTITKSRESWTEQDHDKFLEALQLFDRDWKKIEAFVGSKTVIQIRSHAQKYFLKVQKNGTNEHVPPPRPKRKAAHPYPQKASKNVSQIPEAKTVLQASCLHEPGYSSTRETPAMLRNHTAMAVPLVQSPAQPVSACHLLKDDIANAGVPVTNNCCSSSTDSPGTWPSCETIDQENLITSLHVMPDFTQVYSFLASVFDPNTSGHLEKLKLMDPINVETVLLLMRNLSFNLTSPEFEAHRRLLSTHGDSMEEAKAHNIRNTFHPREAANTPLLIQGK